MDQIPSLDLVRRFLDASRSEKNLGHRTLKAYTSDLEQFVRFLGSRSMLSLDVNDLREYVKFLEERGLKDTSIKRKLACIKVFFAFLCSEGLINSSPVKRLGRRFKTRTTLPRAMSLEDVSRLLRCVNNGVRSAKREGMLERYRAIRDRAILELLFSTGMRVDEVTLLNVEDLDLISGQVRISGKGRKERLVYITSPEVTDCLKSYMSARGSLSPATEAIFLNRSKSRLGPGTIGSIFKRFAALAGITTHYTPHCLRHTMATMLVENGADIRSIQEILGHSRISTTEIYLHVSSSRQREVLTRFNGRNNIHVTGR